MLILFENDRKVIFLCKGTPLMLQRAPSPIGGGSFLAMIPEVMGTRWFTHGYDGMSNRESQISPLGYFASKTNLAISVRVDDRTDSNRVDFPANYNVGDTTLFM